MRFVRVSVLILFVSFYINSVSAQQDSPDDNNLIISCLKTAKNKDFRLQAINACLSEMDPARKIECLNRASSGVAPSSYCDSTIKSPGFQSRYPNNDHSTIEIPIGDSAARSACSSIADPGARDECLNALENKAYASSAAAGCNRIHDLAQMKECYSTIEGGCYEFTAASICSGIRAKNPARAPATDGYAVMMGPTSAQNNHRSASPIRYAHPGVFIGDDADESPSNPDHDPLDPNDPKPKPAPASPPRTIRPVYPTNHFPNVSAPTPSGDNDGKGIGSRKK